MTHRSASRICAAGAIGWAFALLPLAGCLQTVPLPGCQPTAQAAQSSVRMMISFRQPTAGDAPEVLLQLQRHTQGCVSYLSSVSPTLHVYAISAGGDAEALRLHLRSMPTVLDAVSDERAKAQTLR